MTKIEHRYSSKWLQVTMAQKNIALAPVPGPYSATRRPREFEAAVLDQAG